MVLCPIVAELLSPLHLRLHVVNFLIIIIIILIIISIFVKLHKVVTSEALAAVGCVC